MLDRYQLCLDHIKDGQYRRLWKPAQDLFLDFSSNDYLGFSKHPEALAYAMKCAQDFGLGATGSRLLSGQNRLFMDFEAQIAKDKKTDKALLFATGFQANTSVLACLLDQKVLGQKPLVFFDKWNHSSLYQGVFLAQAELVRYHHNHLDHLRELLTLHEQTSRPKFLVTETLFGMDGDLLPLAQIVDIAQEFGLFLYLDEAHGTGILGPKGYGLSTCFDFGSVPHVIMGTLSKALGSSGAYVATHSEVYEYLINRCPGWIYSTAPSPFAIGGAFWAWTQVPDQKRDHLFALGQKTREHLTLRGFDVGRSETHIVPVILKDEKLALTMRDQLLDQGFRVSCVRPPTVPPGTSRIRLAFQTGHSWDDWERLMKAINLSSG